MNKSIKILFLGMIAVFIGTFFQSNISAHADHDKYAIIIKMADIKINLEHFPTVDEKKKLQSVLDSASSTDQKKIIANAKCISNINPEWKIKTSCRSLLITQLQLLQ